MTKFKTAVKGYDKREVDAYLHKTTEFHESKVRELEDHIKRLKEENDYLYAKNSEYHRNEERVSDAIIKAMQIKEKLEKEYRKKIALEEDRLKIFKTKWIAYARGLHHANADRVIEDVDGYMQTFRRDFIKQATRDLALEDAPFSAAEQSYFAEQRRLRLQEEDQEEGEKMSAASLLQTEEEDDAKDQNGFTEE